MVWAIRRAINNLEIILKDTIAKTILTAGMGAKRVYGSENEQVEKGF